MIDRSLSKKNKSTVEVPPSESSSEPEPLSLVERSPQRWVLVGGGIVLGIGIGLAVAFGGTRWFNNSSSPPVQQAIQPTLSVTTAPVESSTVPGRLSATGTVTASNLLPVLPQATGLQVRQVLVDEGQTVQAGQTLAVLDDSVLQTQLQQAQAQLNAAQSVVRQKQAVLNQQRANLAQAQRELQRYQFLANQGAIARQELDTRTTAVETAAQTVAVAQADIANAQAAVQSNQAQIRTLQTQLGQTLVKAPASGVIAQKNAEVGDVTSNQQLFSIIRNDALELQVKVPETQLPQVQVGAPVLITSHADSRIHLSGKVREISPLVDPQTRQATVKIALPSSPLLRPGMFVQAAIASGTTQGLTVPFQAVIPQSEGQATVYVLDNNNIAHARTVETGATIGADNPDTARVAIQSGLQAGDCVVVTGAGYLKDGDKVAVVPPS